MGSEWSKISLQDTLSFIVDNRGKTVPTIDDENGIALIATNCVNNTHLYPEFKNIRYISNEIFNTWFRAHPEPEDILFTLKGSQNGAACVVPNVVNFAIAQDMVALRVNKSVMHPYFLLAVLRSREIQHQIKNFDSSDVIPHFKKGYFKKLMLPCPPREATEAIGELYKTFEYRINLNRQINQTLEQMAQALFKSWFVDFDPVIDNALDAGNPIPEEFAERAERRAALKAAMAQGAKKGSVHDTLSPELQASLSAAFGDGVDAHQLQSLTPLPDDIRKLFPSEFEETELGWVPKGWEYKNIGSLLTKTIGGDWGKEHKDDKHTEQSCIIRGTDIPDLIAGKASNAPVRWVEPKKLKTRKLEAGDIVIEVSGGSPKQPTGRSLFITDEIINRLGGTLEPASFCRRFQPITFELGLLISLHLRKIYTDGKMWEYQNQSTGIANFQTNFFLDVECVVVPSSEVLEKFFSTVNPWLSKAQNSDSLTLEKLRDTLLPKLISGELRLDDIDVTNNAVAQPTE